MMRRVTLAMAAALAALVAGLSPAQDAKQAGDPPGWKLVWADEFAKWRKAQAARPKLAKAP